jgi:hypothetical protein
MIEDIYEEIDERIKLVDKAIYKELTFEESLVSDGKAVLEDVNLISVIEDLKNMQKINTLDFNKFIDCADVFVNTADKVKEIRDRLEYAEFLKTGNKYDQKKLESMFKQRELKKKFPNFKLKRYLELVNNPVLELTNFQGEVIPYDPFIISKMIIGINQLIFDEMDLRIINVGKEGSGKSCLASQYILYLWWFCTEIGLINYPYDVTKLFYSSVSKLLEEQDNQKENDYARIFCLDEGYELNRQNFREEDSRNYKDSMRSDRKMLRIEIVNLPQLGELELAITQTRTNFILEADLSNSIKTSTLKKGDVNFYIIPRGNTIYSRYLRKEIPSKHIINELSRVLKDKNDSYKGLPESILIHRSKFKGVWGFDKSIYDSFIKKENKVRRKKSKIKLTDYQAYILHTKAPALKYWDNIDKKTPSGRAIYKTVQKFLSSIKGYFDNNPNLYTSFRNAEELKNETK